AAGGDAHLAARSRRPRPPRRSRAGGERRPEGDRARGRRPRDRAGVRGGGAGLPPAARPRALLAQARRARGGRRLSGPAADGPSRTAAATLSLRPMGQTTEKPRIQGPGSGLGGNWRVIVKNDDHNTFDHVARTLARYIPGVTVALGYDYADRI